MMMVSWLVTVNDDDDSEDIIINDDADDDDGELVGNSQLPRSALLPNRVKRWTSNIFPCP